MASVQTGNMSNEQIIYAYLKGMGLSDIAAAGVLGNWKIESNLDPTASNSGEGAIGLAQWEGGRRTEGLDVFAKQVNLPETDIRTQLGWFQKEITGPYSSVLDNLKSVRDPGTAAALFDANYEVSSGAARQQRIDAANQFYQQMQAGNFSSITPISSDQLLSIHIPNIPGTGGLFNPGGIGGGGVGSLLGDITAPIKSIGKFFDDLVWIFQPGHFLRACLYVFGFLAIITGIYMAVTGTGIERPG